MILLTDFIKIPYDLNMKPPNTVCELYPCFICDCCKREFSVTDSITVENSILCLNCIDKFICKKASNTELTDNFIKEHEDEFYINYYLKNMDSEQKLSLAKRSYNESCFDRAGMKDTYFKELEEMFCCQHDGFFEYLANRL